MLYIQHYIKTVHFWLKYNGFDTVRKTTKLIERGHRGFRTIGILLSFFTFFENPKSRDFYGFFAVLCTFSRTMLVMTSYALPRVTMDQSLTVFAVLRLVTDRPTDGEMESV